jgi:hypothetical protein
MSGRGRGSGVRRRAMSGLQARSDGGDRGEGEETDAQENWGRSSRGRRSDEEEEHLQSCSDEGRVRRPLGSRRDLGGTEAHQEAPGKQARNDVGEGEEEELLEIWSGQGRRSQGDDGDSPGIYSEGHRGRRAQGRGRGHRHGGVPRSVPKGRNFIPEEERKLTRSVLAISQDPIRGNQQKSGAFWERIGLHYDDYRPGGYRGCRSLESKWGLIKHDVAKFIGVYKQILCLNKSGTSATDILHMARELYRTKSAKHSEFTYEHCWLLVIDFPKWADGWCTNKQATPSKRKATSSDHESQTEAPTLELGSVLQPVGDTDSNRAFRDRPSGTKVAKDLHKDGKVRDHALYAQAKATEEMAAPTMQKAVSLKEQNLLFLMTAPVSEASTPEAQEYLRLWHADELKKLRRRLAAEEDSESRVHVAEDQQRREKVAADEAQARAEVLENLEMERQLRAAHRQCREDVDDDFIDHEADDQEQFGQGDDFGNHEEEDFGNDGHRSFGNGEDGDGDDVEYLGSRSESPWSVNGRGRGSESTRVLDVGSVGSEGVGAV